MLSQNAKNSGIEQFKSALRRHAMKATPQRLAVHEAMLRLGHASADTVTEEIRKSASTNVTVASVYNILTNLAGLGIYKRRMSANNKMYFDVNTFKDIIDEELMLLIESHLGHKKFRGFKIDDIDIQIIGHPSKSKKTL